MRRKLGEDPEGKAVYVDVDRLVGSRALLQANSGAGKSWTLRRLLEITHGKIQHLVLDPEGEFYTLRESFDYVLAGKGGDCPAEPRSAHLLARKLLELGTSAIIDLYELDLPEKRAFVARFLQALVGAPRKLWHPALVVVDEAHIFAPEKGRGESESLQAVIDLMSRGRKRGFCGVLATQRISKLHKDAAADANNYLIGRAALDVDRKRAAAELGLSGKAEEQSLRRLKEGQFYAFGPALTDDVTLIQVGEVLTRHPKAGAGAPPVSPPRATVQKVLSQLVDIPAEAVHEERTVEALEGRVRSLERDLRQAQAEAPPPSEEAIEAAREGARRDAEARTKKLVGEIAARDGRIVEGLEAALDALKRAKDAAQEPVPEFADALAPPLEETRRRWFDPAKAEARDRAYRSRQQSQPSRDKLELVDATLDGPMQRCMDALEWLRAAGLRPPYSRGQVAFLAGYKPGTGSYQNALGRLSTAGLISYPSPGAVQATEAGKGIGRAPDLPRTVEAFQEAVLEKLDGPMRRCLGPLVDAYPKALGRDVLAEKAGYTAGTGSFQNALGRLRKLGLIEYPDRGSARAEGVLFLES